MTQSFLRSSQPQPLQLWRSPYSLSSPAGDRRRSRLANVRRNEALGVAERWMKLDNSRACAKIAMLKLQNHEGLGRCIVL